MDEPFASVDEQIRRKFQEDLLELLSDEHKTVVFVTHSIEEAVYVSDLVVIMSRGPGRVSNVVRPGIDREAVPTASGAAPSISTGSSESGSSYGTTSRSDGGEMTFRGTRSR